MSVFLQFGINEQQQGHLIRFLILILALHPRQYHTMVISINQEIRSVSAILDKEVNWNILLTKESCKCIILSMMLAVRTFGTRKDASKQMYRTSD